MISLVLILHSVGTTGRLSIIFHSPPNPSSCFSSSSFPLKEKKEKKSTTCTTFQRWTPLMPMPGAIFCVFNRRPATRPPCSFNTAREGREKREERALQFPSIASFVLPRTFARSFPICKENAEIGIEFDWIELIHTLSITTTPINDVPLWLHSRVRSSSRPTTIINNDAKL